MKALICIPPDGSVTFVSSIFEGAITDAHLVEQCGILAKLEPSDSIMADKGFDIQHLLAPTGVRLNIPPFRWEERVFTPDAVMKAKKIAAVRIHVAGYQPDQGVLPSRKTHPEQFVGQC